MHFDDVDVRNPRSLERRVLRAAEDALVEREFVSAIDVLVGLGWLPPRRLDEWRQGRIDYLEGAMPVHLTKVSTAMRTLQSWAQDRGLVPSETAYVARTRDRRSLRFSARGEPDIERAYLDHLVLLPSGDAALTRRASKASRLSAVVVRFSRSRRRYERQGILVEETALERAERECLADEEARARRREREQARRDVGDTELQVRMAREIARLFPGCPRERARAIAAHTGVRGSGRVGRTAAGRALDSAALALAVAASVRHLDTEYDELLMAGLSRPEARERVWPEMERILERWRGMPPAGLGG